VLPFANMSGDPEQEYFVDGMVEEIITALSRIRWLFVIARNSSFTYKGQAVDVKQVGRELGVRYVLEGSVRKAGNRVRITGQLIDAETGAHLWADRFDGSLEDVFELQDKVASSVAGVIEPALQAAETARSAARPTADLTAYDLYLRAYAMASSSARFPEALRLTEKAIERDPRYGPALAGAALCCFRLVQDSRSEDPRADRLKGIDFARRALDRRRRRSAHPGDCRPRAGLFRRGYRRHDGVGRPRPGAQPEFRVRLAHQRQPQALGGPVQHRDRAYRSLDAAQSPRPRWPIAAVNRYRAFLQPALR
jgi:TolB-like protein